MRATGEFTRVEVAAMEDRLDTVKFNLDRLRETLERKREESKSGYAKARAMKIGGALKDARFRGALRALDEAERLNDLAARAFARCRPSSKTGMLTKTGRTRQDEKAETTRIMDSARVAFRSLDAAHEGVCLNGKVGARRLSEANLKSELRVLIASYKVGDLPDQVEAAGEEFAILKFRLELAAARRVTDAKLKAFARYLDEKPRKLLVRLAVDHYKPKPSTIKKLKPELDALAEAGLAEEERPTRLGQDVAKWTSENMAGQGAKQQRALTGLQVRASFTQDQLQEMARKGRAALVLIRRDGPGVDNLELGLPDEGVSYRIVRTQDAVQTFLGVIMSGILRKKKKGEGPKLLRKKRPTFVQGEILEGEPSPCGAA